MGGLADRLEGHVRQLAGEIGERHIHRPKALHAAADYIRQSWEAMGYDVSKRDYPVLGVPSANLEAVRPGSARPDEILVVGAHYDTVRGSPGANDNASGVAALLELSRLLAGAEPERTVRLVAFTNEERPFVFLGQQGSHHYARAARRRGDDIRLMIALETMGYYSSDPDSQRYPPGLRRFYPDRADFIGFVSNLPSRRPLNKLVRAFREASDFPCQSLAAPVFVPGVGRSDHFSFWRQGYRAIMVTDTAYYRYAHYHRPEDTPGKLDYPSLARVVEGLFRALLPLAEGEL
ncbi:MAG: aminopeptidase [Desulfuromonas sp.]|uniref:M28 family peptidase n=1 Tax=Desulfuromonas sp. TaxID=892 RepID=UPI000CC7F786|nr:M28 family peptidase [Desulfuromonas sp.]PLX84852.1 MAG: aminopeptidase [Desulfuromonas sp.]